MGNCQSWLTSMVVMGHMQQVYNIPQLHWIALIYELCIAFISIAIIVVLLLEWLFQPQWFCFCLLFINWYHVRPWLTFVWDYHWWPLGKCVQSVSLGGWLWFLSVQVPYLIHPPSCPQLSPWRPISPHGTMVMVDIWPWQQSATG